MQGGPSQEAGHFSDTTASAGGSDDEGSTAATDGSTLRTSPAEQVNSLNYLIVSGFNSAKFFLFSIC